MALSMLYSLHACTVSPCPLPDEPRHADRIMKIKAPNHGERALRSKKSTCRGWIFAGGMTVPGDSTSIGTAADVEDGLRLAPIMFS